MIHPRKHPAPKSSLAAPLRWRRIVDAADAERIRTLVTAAGIFSAEEVGNAAEMAATTLAGTETYRFLFAETLEGALLGYACFDRIPLSAVSWELYWIVVAPEFQGTGVAQQLLDNIAKLAREKHGVQMFVETSSRERFAAARAFYRKVGFEEAARFPDFYDKGDDRCVFRLML